MIRYENMQFDLMENSCKPNEIRDAKVYEMVEHRDGEKLCTHKQSGRESEELVYIVIYLLNEFINEVTLNTERKNGKKTQKLYTFIIHMHNNCIAYA